MMSNILNTIKSGATTLLITLAGILAVIASVAVALFQREKAKAAQQELEDEKAATEQANKATDALIKGVENESKPDTSPRDYKF